MGTPWELDGNTVVTHWERTQKRKEKSPPSLHPTPKKNPKEKEKRSPPKTVLSAA